MFLVTQNFDKRKNMKKTLIIAAACLLHTFSANAAGKVGQCVYPNTKPAKNSGIQFKNPVYLFNAPSASETKQLLTSLTSFSIKAEKNGFIQLVTVPDYSAPDPDKTAGKIVGWAKLADFQMQDLRNCN